jgi:hypothetical protein
VTLDVRRGKRGDRIRDRGELLGAISRGDNDFLDAGIGFVSAL